VTAKDFRTIHGLERVFRIIRRWFGVNAWVDGTDISPSLQRSTTADSIVAARLRVR